MEGSSSSNSNSCPDELLLDAIKIVHGLGAETCSMVNRHPSLGVFQGIPQTKVELFFERPLNMCMALGVEHSLSTKVCMEKVLMAAYPEAATETVPTAACREQREQGEEEEEEELAQIIYRGNLAARCDGDKKQQELQEEMHVGVAVDE